MSWKIPEPSGELHFIASGCLTVISSDRSELEQLLVIYALVLSASRFNLKNSCSLDFLRIAEPQESFNTFGRHVLPLARHEPLKWGVVKSV